jgi:hypothetical protein
MTKQKIRLKDEKTFSAESEQLIKIIPKTEKGAATAVQSFQLDVGLEGLRK